MNKWWQLLLFTGSIVLYLYNSIPTYMAGTDSELHFPELVIPEALISGIILIMLTLFLKKHYKQKSFSPLEVLKIKKQPSRIILQLLFIGVLATSISTEYAWYSLATILAAYLAVNTGIALLSYSQKPKDYNKTLFHYFVVYPIAIIAFITLLFFGPMFIFGYMPHPT